jgi:hypothetical protein
VRLSAKIVEGCPQIVHSKPAQELDCIEQVGLAGCIRPYHDEQWVQVETKVLERLEAIDLDSREHCAGKLIVALIRIRTLVNIQNPRAD